MKKQTHKVSAFPIYLMCRLQWTMDIYNSLLTHLQVEGDIDGRRSKHQVTSDGLCMQEVYHHNDKVQGNLCLSGKLVFFPNCGYFGALSICFQFLQPYISDPSVFIASIISSLKVPIKITHKLIHYVFFITNYTTKLHPALNAVELLKVPSSWEKSCYRRC